MDREKLIQEACAAGIPLHKVEEHFDWIENEARRRDRARWSYCRAYSGAPSRFHVEWVAHLSGPPRQPTQ